MRVRRLSDEERDVADSLIMVATKFSTEMMVGMGLIRLGMGLMRLGMGLMRLGMGIMRLGIGLMKLGMGLMRLGIISCNLMI